MVASMVSRDCSASLASLCRNVMLSPWLGGPEVPAMPQIRYATGPLCHRPVMPQARYATSPLCHRSAMPQARYATGSLCHRSAMPQVHYACLYVYAPADGRTHARTDRQTDRQTDTHTHTHTPLLIELSPFPIPTTPFPPKKTTTPLSD